MKIGFGIVDLAPQKDVMKFFPGGGGIQTHEVKDELTAKVTMLENNDGSLWVHISLPFGDISTAMHAHLKKDIEAALNKTVTLTSSCTHTHYGPNIAQSGDYEDYFIGELAKAIPQIELMQKDHLAVRYQYRYFDEAGRIRISGVDTQNLYLETFSIYEEEKRLATLIVYNSHPTTLNFNESFLSGAGPAVMLKNLRESYPGTHFTYGIGAAGDISTRFTRKGQSYDDMLDLCEKVTNGVKGLLENEANIEPVALDEWKATEIMFPVKRAPRNMDEIDMSGELTPRELETIEIAKKKHANQDISILPTEIFMQKVELAGHTFIFTPFELFSSYLECIDKEKATLVNLCNGGAGYLSGPGIQKMSFEVLGETIPTESKLKLMELLKEWGGKA